MGPGPTGFDDLTERLRVGSISNSQGSGFWAF